MSPSRLSWVAIVGGVFLSENWGLAGLMLRIGQRPLLGKSQLDLQIRQKTLEQSSVADAHFSPVTVEKSLPLTRLID